MKEIRTSVKRFLFSNFPVLGFLFIINLTFLVSFLIATQSKSIETILTAQSVLGHCFDFLAIITPLNTPPISICIYCVADLWSVITRGKEVDILDSKLFSFLVCLSWIIAYLVTGVCFGMFTSCGFVFKNVSTIPVSILVLCIVVSNLLLITGVFMTTVDISKNVQFY